MLHKLCNIMYATKLMENFFQCQIELLGSHVSLGKTIIEETVKFKQKLMGELKSTHHLPPSYLTGNIPSQTGFRFSPNLI